MVKSQACNSVVPSLRLRIRPVLNAFVAPPAAPVLRQPGRKAIVYATSIVYRCTAVARTVPHAWRPELEARLSRFALDSTLGDDAGPALEPLASGAANSSLRALRLCGPTSSPQLDSTLGDRPLRASRTERLSGLEELDSTLGDRPPRASRTERLSGLEELDSTLGDRPLRASRTERLSGLEELDSTLGDDAGPALEPLASGAANSSLRALRLCGPASAGDLFRGCFKASRWRLPGSSGDRLSRLAAGAAAT
eukprot:tig00020598_g11710.t1